MEMQTKQEGGNVPDKSLGLRAFLQANPVATPEERQELIKNYYLNFGQRNGGNGMFPGGLVPGAPMIMQEFARNPGPAGYEKLGTITDKKQNVRYTIEDVETVAGPDGVPEPSKINYVAQDGTRMSWDLATNNMGINPTVKADWGTKNPKTGNPRVPLNLYDQQQGTDRNPFKHPVKYVSELLMGPNEDTVSDQTLPFSSKWTPDENKLFQQTGQIPAGRDARDLNGTAYQPWVNRSTLNPEQSPTIKNNGVIDTMWGSNLNPIGLAHRALNAPADWAHNGQPLQLGVGPDAFIPPLNEAKPAYATNAAGQGYTTQPESHSLLTPIKGSRDDGIGMGLAKGLGNVPIAAGQMIGGLAEFLTSPLGATTMAVGPLAAGAARGAVGATEGLAAARAAVAAATTPAELAAAQTALTTAANASRAANVISGVNQAIQTPLHGKFAVDMGTGAYEAGKTAYNEAVGNVPVYNKEGAGYENRGTTNLAGVFHEGSNALMNAAFAGQIGKHTLGTAKDAIMPGRAAIDGAVQNALTLPPELQMNRQGSNIGDYLFTAAPSGETTPWQQDRGPNYRPSFEPQGQNAESTNTSPELGATTQYRPASATQPENSDAYRKARTILSGTTVNNSSDALPPETLAEVIKKAAEPKYEITPEMEAERLRIPRGQGEGKIDPEYQRMRGVAEIIGNERVDMANLIAGPGAGRGRRGVDVDPKAAAEAAQRAALGLKPGEPLPAGIPGSASADKSAAELAASTGPSLTAPEAAKPVITDREYDVINAVRLGTDFLSESNRADVLAGDAVIDPRNVDVPELAAAKAQGMIEPFRKANGVQYWKFTEKGLDLLEQQMEMDGYEIGWKGKEEAAPAAPAAAAEAPAAAEKVVMAIDIVKALPPLPEYKNVLTKQLNDIYMDNNGRPRNPTKISKTEMARGKAIREKLEEIASKEPAADTAPVSEPAAAPASVADVVAPVEPAKKPKKPKVKPAAPLEPVVEPAKEPVTEPVTAAAAAEPPAAAAAAPLIDTSSVVPPQPKVNVSGPTVRGGPDAPRQRGERGVRTGPWLPDANAQAAQAAAPQTRAPSPAGQGRVRPPLAKPQFSARGTPILSAKQMFEKNEGKLNRLTYSHLKDLYEETVADPSHNPQFAARVKDEMSNRENRFKDTYSNEQEGRNLISGDPVETMTDAQLKDVVDNGQARIKAQKEIVAGHNRGDYRSPLRERSQEGKDALRELNRLQYQWQFAKQEQNKRVRVNAGIARPDGSRIVASKERQMMQMRVDPLTGEEKAAPKEKRKPVEALNHARGRFDKLSLDELVAAEAELRKQGRGYADKVADAIQARLKEGDAVHRRLHGKDADNIPNPRTATREQLEGRIPDLKQEVARLEAEAAEQRKAGNVDPQTAKSLSEAKGDLSGFEKELASRDAMETADIRYEANKNNFKQVSGDIQGTGTTPKGNGYKPQVQPPAPEKAPPVEGRDKDVIRNEGAAAYEAEQRAAAARANPNPLGLEGQGRDSSKATKTDATLERLRTVEDEAAQYVVHMATTLRQVERELKQKQRQADIAESNGQLTREINRDLKIAKDEVERYREYEREAMEDLQNAQDRIAEHQASTSGNATPVKDKNIADRIIEKYGTNSPVPLSRGAKAVVERLKESTGRDFEVVILAGVNAGNLDVSLRDVNTKERVARADSTIKRDGSMHVDFLSTDEAFTKKGVATGLVTQLLKLASEELREVDPAGGERKITLADFSEGGASTKALARATDADVTRPGLNHRVGTFDQNRDYSRGSAGRGRGPEDNNQRKQSKTERERFVANEAVYMRLSPSQRRLADTITRGGSTIGDILKQIVNEAKLDKGQTSSMTKMAELLLKNSDSKSLSKLVEMNKDRFLNESYYESSGIAALNRITKGKKLQTLGGEVSMSQLHLSDPKDLMRAVMHEFIHATTSDKINRAIFGRSGMGEFNVDHFGQSGQKYIDRIRAYVRDPKSDKGIVKIGQAYLKYLSTLDAKEFDNRPVTTESLNSARNAETGESWRSNVVGQGIDTLSHQDHGQYRVSNFHEFTAAAMTEPDFQNILRGIKMGNSNAWVKFKDSVAEIIGIAPSDSALRQTFDGVMEVSMKDLSEFKKGDFESQGEGLAQVRMERFIEEGMDPAEARQRAIDEISPDRQDAFGFGKQTNKDLRTPADIRADIEEVLAEERQKANSPNIDGYFGRQDKVKELYAELNEAEAAIVENTKNHPLYEEALRNVEDNNLGDKKDVQDTNDAVAQEIRRLEGVNEGNYDAKRTGTDRTRFYEKSRRSEQDLGEELRNARDKYDTEAMRREAQNNLKAMDDAWENMPAETKAQAEYDAVTSMDSFQERLFNAPDSEAMLADLKNAIADTHGIDPSMLLEGKGSDSLMLGDKEAGKPQKDITGPMTEADWDGFEQSYDGSKRGGEPDFEPNSKKGAKILNDYLHERNTYGGKTHEQMMQNPEVAHVLKNIENFTKASKEDVVNAIRKIGEKGNEIVKQLERGDITLRDAVKLAEEADRYTYLRELGDIRDKRKGLFKALQRHNGDLRKISESDGRRGNTHAARETKNNLGLEGQGRDSSKAGNFVRRETQASINRAKDTIEAIKKFTPDSKLDVAHRATDIVTLSALNSGQAHLDKLAERNNVPAIREINDLLMGGRAGDMTRAVKNGFHSKVKSENNRLNNSLNNALRPLEERLENMSSAEQAKLLEDVGRAVVSKTTHPDAQIAAAADAVRAVYRDMYYMQKNAGIELGNSGPNYMPRMLNHEIVLKDRQKFVNAAAKAYETTGLDPVDAMDAANDWWYSIQRGDEGFSFDGNFVFDAAAHNGEPKHTRGRIFNDIAEGHMEPFYNRNVIDATRQYIGRAVKATQLAQRFGADFGRYRDLEQRIIDSGPKGEGLLREVNETVKGQLAPQKIGNSVLRGANDALAVYQSVRFLSRAVISSLGEPIVGAMRTGQVADAGVMMFDSVKQAYRQARRLEPDYHTKLAEDIGAIQSILSDSAITSSVDSRMIDTVSNGLSKKVQNSFFRTTGLHQWTEGTRVASIKLGERFIRRLALDVEGGGRSKELSARYLTELGIDAKDHASFSKFIKQLEGMDQQTRLKTITNVRNKHAAAYRDALVRFGEQVIMDPNRGNRARMANHPLGGLIFGLQSYLYAFNENVVKRTMKTTGAAVFNSDNNNMSASNRMMLLAPLAIAPIFAAFQYGQGEFRDEFLSDPARANDEPLSAGNKFMRMMSRSAFLGRHDFVANLFGSFKYDKDPATAVAGPALGDASTYLKNKIGLYKDSNSPDTNTAERRSARSDYDSGIAPGLGLIASQLPGVAGRVIGAGVTYAANHPATRENYVEKVAGPPVAPKKQTQKQKDARKNFIDLLMEEQ